jgi:hypothetical protein
MPLFAENFCMHAHCDVAQAAEAAIQALESGDDAAIAAAEATAAAAHARSSIAMEANSKAFKLAKQYEEQQAKRQAQDQAAEQEPEAEEAEPGQCADAAADDSMAGIQEQADAVADAAVAAEGNGDADLPSAAPGGADEVKERGGAAACNELAYQPSWARGGGGRGRAGGRFRGIDPIYPVEDPKILEVRTGCTQRSRLLIGHAMLTAACRLDVCSVCYVMAPDVCSTEHD